MKVPEQATARLPWNHHLEAKAFHKSHKYTPYVMIWVKTLEAEMMNEELPREWRVLAAIRRFSWGNFADIAVTTKPKKKPTDELPRPMTQDRLSEILGIRPSRMTDIVKFLRETGFLRKNHQYLFPEELESPLESTKDTDVEFQTGGVIHSPYLRWEKEYFKAEGLEPIVDQLVEERKSFQEKAREKTRELHQLKLQALVAYRKSHKAGEDVG
jgi:hypothetical protein